MARRAGKAKDVPAASRLSARTERLPLAGDADADDEPSSSCHFCGKVDPHEANLVVQILLYMTGTPERTRSAGRYPLCQMHAQWLDDNAMDFVKTRGGDIPVVPTDSEWVH